MCLHWHEAMKFFVACWNNLADSFIILGLSAEEKKKDPFEEDEEECKVLWLLASSWKEFLLGHSNKIHSFWSPPAFKKTTALSFNRVQRLLRICASVSCQLYLVKMLVSVSFLLVSSLFYPEQPWWYVAPLEIYKMEFMMTVLKFCPPAAVLLSFLKPSKSNRAPFSSGALRTGSKVCQPGFWTTLP